MNVFIIDFETTSADPTTARPWEFFGSVVTPAWYSLTSVHSFMWSPDYEDITPGAMRACKLQHSRLATNMTFKHFFEQTLLPAIEKCSVTHWMAYNAPFDRAILEYEAARQEVKLPKIDWLCAMSDIEYAEHFRCKQLSHLALDHGIEVKPSELHGATGDVNLLTELLKKGAYKLEDIVSFKTQPWVYIQAILPDPWGATKVASEKLRVIAKKDGFSWETTRVSDRSFPKKWVKAVKAGKLQAELDKLRPYPVSQIGD